MFVGCRAFVSLPQRGSMFVLRATTLCRLQRSRMFVGCWAFVSLPQRGSMFVVRATSLRPAPAEPNVCRMLGIRLPAPAGQYVCSESHLSPTGSSGADCL